MKTGIPAEYHFAERASIFEAFYRPDAETLEGPLALARRIQVTVNLVTFCGLREPCRPGKGVPLDKKNDNRDEELKGEEDVLSAPPLAQVSHRCVHHLPWWLQPGF
jgi:hypothetical protein